jgi:hypothetical protein
MLATCQFVADLDPTCMSGPTFSRSQYHPKKKTSAAFAPLSLPHRLRLKSSRLCLFPCLLVWLVVALSCCVSSIALSCCVISSRRHVTLCCVASSCLVVMSSCHLVVSSHLASSLRCAPLHISSHSLCSVGCCVVTLHLVHASPRMSRHRDLHLCRSLLSRCVSSRRHIASRYHVPSCSFLSSGLI